MIAALGTVLVVDDDVVLRSSLESVLGDLGYRFLSTGSPDVAYQLLGSESAVAEAVAPLLASEASGGVERGWRELEAAGKLGAYLNAALRAQDIVLHREGDVLRRSLVRQQIRAARADR